MHNIAMMQRDLAWAQYDVHRLGFIDRDVDSLATSVQQIGITKIDVIQRAESMGTGDHAHAPIRLMTRRQRDPC